LDYWQTQNKPHRRFLLQVLLESHSDSYFEVGCNSGPNLALIREALPSARLGGIDVNAAAVTLCAAKLPEAEVLIGDIYTDLLKLSPSSYDVVFTCYALAYVHPTALSGVIESMIRLARDRVVIFERHADLNHPPGRDSEGIIEWRHDYCGVLRSLGYKPFVRPPEQTQNLTPVILEIGERAGCSRSDLS